MPRRKETVLARNNANLVKHYSWALKLFPTATFIADKDGVIRFRQNYIIDYLFTQGKLDLNQILFLTGDGVFNRHDLMALYMDFGYSLSGFTEIFGPDLDDMEDKNLTFDKLTDERHLLHEDVEDDDA